jgi:predicted ATPase
LIVVTGGPGAGKTALLEVVRRQLCQHVAVLPESASILFAGGFPRRATFGGRRSAQRAIFHVQRELERMVGDEGASAVALCDRGTLDGLAYWPGDLEDFWAELGIDSASELSRYAAVVHLRSPDSENGYHRNPVRIESAREAREIDERILQAWSAHPNRHVVESTHDFLEKVQRALAILHAELPGCCRPRATAEAEASR